MTKLIKRFTISFCAALLALTTLCANAFAAEPIKASVSGDMGSKRITYSYSVSSKPTQASIGFYTADTANSYLITFSPASGSSATIYFYESFSDKLLDSLTVPIKAGGGMPSSFITSADLGKYKFVYVVIKSNSSSNASGWFTIEGVYSETYIN
ncbi:MAG TPA: hypothetical protein DDX91_05080 [Ruminococcaceae bacterium]|nr:hypothetical protein [Oscillospiraceae bacterium]